MEFSDRESCVGSGLFCSSGGGACHRGTEASLTKKGSLARAQGCWTRCKQVRQPVLVLDGFPQVTLCLC